MLLADVGPIFDAAAAFGTVAAAIVAAAALRKAAIAAKASADAAKATGDAAKSSARAATATEQQLAAQTLPIVLEDPQGGPLDQGSQADVMFSDGELRTLSRQGEVLVETNSEAGRLSVPVRNFGPGPARVTQAWISSSQSFPAQRPDNPFCWLVWEGQTVVIPAGESRRLTLRCLRESPPTKDRTWEIVRSEATAWKELRSAAESNRISVLMTWEDLSGLHGYQTQLVIARLGDRWHVDWIQLRPQVSPTQGA